MAFRVLCLDGGGAWALIEVRALMALYGEDATGHQVLRNFDLVAANSGGSLVLAGLVENLPLGEILDYFRDGTKRRSVFSPTENISNKILRGVLHVGPKYSARAKLPAIERLLPKTGDGPLAGCTKRVLGPLGAPVHILIVAFDYDRERAVFFRSSPAGGSGWGDGQAAAAGVTLAGAVHASTNAPVNYFDAPAALPRVPNWFWDGAIAGYNNPAVVALVESTVLRQAPRDVRILSLGTGTVALPPAPVGAPAAPLEALRSDSSFTGDLRKLARAIVDDPPDAATFIAHVMTGGGAGLQAPLISRVVRMSPLVSPVLNKGEWKPPKGWSLSRFQYLCTVDIDAVAQSDLECIDDYCTSWLRDHAPNQPIRVNGRTFDPRDPEIGYATFSQALAGWRKLFPLLPAEAATA